MEVNFSQIGQNFAQRPTVDNNIVNSDEQSNSGAQIEATNADTQTGQENQNLADRESVEREALDVESAVSEISDFLQATNRQLSFSIDEKSERQVVKVTDAESGEVIRQIPTEEVLALSERIRELQTDVGSAVGVLFNNQA